MSILLSGYYPEGIVFAADKNATITYVRSSGQKRHVEPTATKVLSWPYRKAVVGFVGLGTLVGLELDPKQASSLRLPRSGADDFTGTQLPCPSRLAG